MTEKQWEQLGQLLENVMNLDLPTWEDKYQAMCDNLDHSAMGALEEIATWVEARLDETE